MLFVLARLLFAKQMRVSAVRVGGWVRGDFCQIQWSNPAQILTVVVVVIFYLSDMGEDCLHIVTFYKSWSAQLTPRAIDGL